MLCLLIAGLIGVSFVPAAEAANGGPADAARAFYDVYMKEYGRDGVPGEAVRAHFATVISSALDRHLADAQRAEALHFRLTKNEEPPLAEGDLFSSLFEGARSYRVGSCVTERDRAYCDVALIYGEAGGGEPVNWTDKASLVRTARGWLVDDIAYGGTWDFGHRGTLQGVLKGIAGYTKEQ